MPGSQKKDRSTKGHKDFIRKTEAQKGIRISLGRQKHISTITNFNLGEVFLELLIPSLQTVGAVIGVHSERSASVVTISNGI